MLLSARKTVALMVRSAGCVGATRVIRGGFYVFGSRFMSFTVSCVDSGYQVGVTRALPGQGRSPALLRSRKTALEMYIL